MDSGRLPWFAIWTRISCDAVLLVGGAIMAWGTLFTGLHPWFFPYGILAAAVVAITACSRKRSSRRKVAFLLLASLLYVVALVLVVAIRDKLDSSVLIALGYLAAWPTLGLLWLVLDRQATSRLDRLTSIDKAEKSYRFDWKAPFARVAFCFVFALWMPVCGFYCATLIPALFAQIKSSSWSQTEGTIVLSEVREETDLLFQGNYNLVYRYQVDGKTYQGTRYNVVHPHLVEETGLVD